MIKFLPFYFLGVYRIPWKNKNTVYHLQISALVLEMFKFKFYIKYIELSRSIFSLDHWNLLG